MTNSKQIISAAVLCAGFFAFTAPAIADSRDRNYRSEYRQDLRDLHEARTELRRDLRRGAGQAEIARDRAAIARELRELREHRQRWDNRHSGWRYGQHRYDDDRYRRWDYRNRGWDRGDRRDRGWHWGWWR